MSLKLFVVSVSNEVMALSEDGEKAEQLVQYGIGYSSGLDGATFYARQVRSVKQVNKTWLDSIPYASKKETSPNYDSLMDMTCKEIMEQYEEEQQRAKDRSEADKLQGKLAL